MRALERLVDRLSGEVRRAAASGDREQASALRAELREARRRWDEALDQLASQVGEPLEDARPPSAAPAGDAPRPAAAPAGDARPPAAEHAGDARPAGAEVRVGGLLPVREQVHQALTLIGAPAAPRLISAVHEAFYAGRLAGARLTSLRRDEERSFRSAPYARPYYLCAALTADWLSPARGLLAISTWPMERRIVGPLSPRVDYLIAAIRIGVRIRDLSGASAESNRLLWRFAANIPHAATTFSTMNADEIVSAAQAELAVHEPADSAQRAAAAGRARSQLDDAEQLFGAGLGTSRQRTAGA